MSTRHLRLILPVAAVLALLGFRCDAIAAVDDGSNDADSREERTERQKIEALIRHIEEMKDAKFVRNGTEYDAKTAGEFLRSKWKSQRKDIRTARDFIEKAATKSSVSGKPYLIRKKDGVETKSADYLLLELEKLETGEC